MPIFPPGRRSRNNRKIRMAKRSVVAALSLTAMVDMFTVLTVFLLQNYKSTGEVIHIPKDVQLPAAAAVKELKPAHIVIVTPRDIFLDDRPVAKFLQVKEQKEWTIAPLYQRLSEVLRQEDIKKQKSVRTAIQKAVVGAKTAPTEEENRKKITLQADKAIDFLTIKKVMFTLSEAGASEINFAVIQKEKPVEVQ